MAFRTIKYWFRKDSHSQVTRDDATTADHILAGQRGESRILAQATDGNLYSYRPEEYGVPRGGSIPITSVLGHAAWTGVWLFALTVMVGGHDCCFHI